MIVALVGRHPANWLIIRMPSRHRRGFPRGRMPSPGLRGINPAFAGLSPCGGQVAYVLRTRAPVAAGALPHRAAPRLACVRPAASVHPEPGSNSSLYSNSSRGCPPARRAGGHYPSCGAPPRRAPYAVPVSSMISLPLRPRGRPPKADAKVRTFSISRQTFPHVFSPGTSLFS